MYWCMWIFFKYENWLLVWVFYWLLACRSPLGQRLHMATCCSSAHQPLFCPLGKRHFVTSEWEAYPVSDSGRPSSIDCLFVFVLMQTEGCCLHNNWADCSGHWILGKLGYMILSWGKEREIPVQGAALCFFFLTLSQYDCKLSFWDFL